MDLEFVEIAYLTERAPPILEACMLASVACRVAAVAFTASIVAMTGGFHGRSQLFRH
jgi:hypothetical protein